jgi:small basic protein (TIGR04137 family)
MSLHRSLKTKPGALNLHRNVLTRPERIAFLSERDLFDEARMSPLALVKVGNRKVKTSKKKAEVAEGAEAGAEVAATPTAAATPAAGAAKAGAPAKGAAKK